MNRVSRYIRVGSEALAASRADWWVWSYAVHGLSLAGLDDVEIGSQFQCSHDKILNARRAHGLFVELWKQGADVRRAAKKLRLLTDKTQWELTAKHYAKHGSLGEALKDMYENSELHADDFKDALERKYGSPLRSQAAQVARITENFVADVMSWADGCEEERKVAIRLARALREAYVPFAEQVELVRDVLREERK